MINKKKPNIGVVTWPILEAGVAPLQRLIYMDKPWLLTLKDEKERKTSAT